MSVIRRDTARPAPPCSPARSLVGDARGFTLIEVLVAMVAAVAVTGALFMILEISLHQTSRITDRVQATQLGRTAMTTIMDELHSACVAREFAPVQEKSTATELRFVTAFSEKPVIGSAEVTKHRIAWVESKAKPNFGKLVDYYYPATGGAWPKFTFEETPAKSVILAEDVYPKSEAKPEVFQYYKYATKVSQGSSEAPSSTLTSTTPPASGFGAEEAKAVAGVLVSFATAPSNNYTALSRAAEFSDQVTFAFGAPAPEATITDGPCQ
jgi:prepilin-type N-terminal cleavage/methylation domain-containing protein